MKPLVLSPLEMEVLGLFYKIYSDKGFPEPNRFRVLCRENTGAGRYVDIHSEVESNMEDGYLDMGGHFIEMEGVPHGLAAVVHVKNHRPCQLELAVYGNVPWDGVERRWSIA